MTRISWQEAIKRFTHIDAKFVQCEIGLPHHDGFFTVELYPWWEHPLYIKARTENRHWGFTESSGEGLRQVTVHPVNVMKFQISSCGDVYDWDFTQQHPVLWEYEDSRSIICNDPLTLEQWLEVADQARENLTGYKRDADVAKYALWAVRRFGKSGSFSLGSFPYTLFEVIRKVLDEQGIRYFIASEPKPKNLPVLFLINGEDYIIAEDFEVDVPEFVHKPEWFQPR